MELLVLELSGLLSTAVQLVIYIYIVYIKHRVSNHLAGFCFKTSYMVFSLSFFYRSRPEKKEQKELNYEKRPRHSTDMKKQMKKQKRPESK